MNDTSAATVAASPPRVTPSVTMPVRVDWGSHLAQIYDHEEPVLEALAAAGIHLALSQVPLGALVEHYIGPNIIHGYAEMAKTFIHSKMDDQHFDASPGTFYSTVADLINKYEEPLSNMMGGKLDGMIKAGLAKIGIAV